MNNDQTFRNFRILTAARLARAPDDVPDAIMEAWRAIAGHVGKHDGERLLTAWPSRERTRLLRGWPEKNGHDMPVLETRDLRVSLDEMKLGRIAHAFPVVQAKESQVALAYHALESRFLEWLGGDTRHAAVLNHGKAAITIFLPVSVAESSIEELWNAFLDDEKTGLFSIDWLQRSFADVMSVVKLSDRGIGTPQVEIADGRQRDMLVGWIIASIRFMKDMMIDNHQRRIRTMTDENPDKNRAEIADRQKRHASNTEKYLPIFQTVETDLVPLVRKECPDALKWSGKTVSDSRFGNTALNQFASDPKKIMGVIAKGRDLAKMDTSKMVRLEPILAETFHPFSEHAAGDDVTTVCYACGRDIPRGKGTAATRLILGNPLRRRQSGGSESAPKVCSQCAVIATLSPFKDADNVLVLEWKPMKNKSPSVSMEHLAEMIVHAQMRIQVGPLVLLGEDEPIKKTTLAKRFGKMPYAALKVADVTSEYVTHLDDVEPVLHIGRDSVSLKIRHVEALQAVLRMLGIENLQSLTREPFVSSINAIEHVVEAVMRDRPYQTLYRYVRAMKVYSENEFLRRGEDFLRRFIRRLETMEGKKSGATEKSLGRADMYNDVAALTGMLVPFISGVEYAIRTKEGPDAPKRPVLKLIEGATNGPNVVTYIRARDAVAYQSVRMIEREENWFLRTQCERMLGEIGIDPETRKQAGISDPDSEDKRQPGIDLNIDDLVAAYAWLADRWPSSGQWKEFTTELKYSLAARFPRYFISE
jgi:hypothetical protein